MADTKKKPRKPKKAVPPRQFQHIAYPEGDVRNEVGGPEGPPPPPGGGGGGGGGQHEIVPGLPPELQAQVDQIFRRYGSDQNVAMRQAIAYLMTTPWFAQNYAGYATGFQKGLFNDAFSGGLADYQRYKNSVQGTFRQHYGRDVTNDELVGFLNQGFDTSRIEKIGAGYSTVQANQGDWQYLSGAFGGGMLTEEEKKAYGEEQAGIDTQLGQTITNKVQAALQRFQGAFQGQVGSSVTGDQQLSARLQKPKDIQA